MEKSCGATASLPCMGYMVLPIHGRQTGTRVFRYPLAVSPPAHNGCGMCFMFQREASSYKRETSARTSAVFSTSPTRDCTLPLAAPSQATNPETPKSQHRAGDQEQLYLDNVNPTPLKHLVTHHLAALPLLIANSSRHHRDTRIRTWSPSLAQRSGVDSKHALNHLTPRSA